jgi:acetyltransferase-like isoleucine patch superfamily enzyme
MRPSNAVPADADLPPTRESNDPRAREPVQAAASLPESQEGAGPVMTAAGVNWMRALRAARQQPGYALRAATSFAKGYYYRVKFRLLGRRVVIGRRFRVTGRLDIRGPGTVIFGDNCFVNSTYIQPTTPWTHSSEAVIRFGNGVGLAGTRIGCRLLVQVGDNTGLSDARIMDSDFHDARGSTENRQNSQGASKPIIIGTNVWLGTGSMILKGVSVGDNATVGAGAVVASNVPANAIVFGNPAKVIWNNAPPEKPRA